MKKNRKNKFIKINKKFWLKFKEVESKKFLLVETQSHPVINHSNAVAAKIVAQAKNWRIAWIKFNYTNEELMRSYSPNSLFISFPKINFLEKFYFVLLSTFYYFYYVLIKKDLLSFKFNKIPYGDFVYDCYLSVFSLATLHCLDFRIITIFYRVLINDKKARFVFNNYPVKAILVSHHIGLKSGPLSRVAMQKKIPVYWKGGGHEIIAMSVFNSLKQMYNYALKPSKKIVDLLAKKHSKSVEKDFEKFINQVDNSYYGALSAGYDNVVFSEVTRESFIKKMKLDISKKNIFVMLHAFNDYPHSHYKEMLFKDYYDWFIQTYKFALNDKSKNWIFKEHPGNKYYPTKDLNLNKKMKNLPSHMRFISQSSKIKASTVLNVADMIVTCTGTAGVEMPALKGIPSIIAGNTFYDHLGFTIEPKSKKEYFGMLKNLLLKKLSTKQQLRAKCCYLYLKKYCMMPFSSGPAITMEESQKGQKLEKTYYQRVLKVYKEKANLIQAEFNEYIKNIKKQDFHHLNKMPS
ncbi:hypothetical protein COT75_02965 [Candidatus Beckwithbacteria bacterium CG10_big_fil_rev_8_21_14_0_10_34_10]|uniref:Capsule polysaccharide biosynthesis protein n=1 Tax=Candidatus Beckwithbacteria bacterium CG10_big_fil_rev_8_21_14_0_10_34_10 TaxID=1974495 RepID=A0A2H0W961_9BACT|nr:MAG: hypothetical protein COT75_02965 [Candidatus Beckwithbacteria bacterium CG10_big_fil_rev_8_21_14_0_10_34_10]